MTIRVRTADPNELLQAIRDAIDRREIDTWEYDKHGDFTHTPTQWRKLAWLRPSASAGTLNFKLLKPEGRAVTDATYAVYHGRFIEMVLAHFNDQISQAEATPR